MSPRPPFFIVGAARSGTSFLADVLDRHASLRVTQELNLLGILDGVRNVTVHRAKMERVGKEESDSAAGLADAAAYVGYLMERELAQSGKQRYGDKFPSYALNIPSLCALFPNCQIVHIVRDGRDVAASLLANHASLRFWRHADWAPKTYAQAAAFWCEHVASARREGAKLGAQRYHELSYEDLMREPERTLGALLAFLGCELDEGTRAALCEVSRNPRSWRETLGASEVAQFEGYAPAAQLLEELGYVRAPAKVTEAALDAAALASGVRARVASGDLAGARELLRAAAAAGHDDALCWSDLAVIEARLGREDEAVRLLVRALRSEAAPLDAAINLLAVPKRDESVLAFERAFARPEVEAIEPLHAWLIARGLPQACAESISLARIALEELHIHLSTDEALAEHGLAAKALAAGRTGEAQQRWAQLRSSDAGLGTLGRVLLALHGGAQREAQEQCQALFELRPLALDALRLLLAQIKSPRLEAAALELALPACDRDPALAAELVRCLTRNGLDVDAAESVVRAFARNGRPRPARAQLEPAAAGSVAAAARHHAPAALAGAAQA